MFSLFIIAGSIPFALISLSHKQVVKSQAAVQNNVYTVVGKKILNSDNIEYVPYGVDVVGLSENGWKNKEGNINLTQNEIHLAHTFWHSNVIRLQISPENLFNNNAGNSFFVRLDQIIGWAAQENMNVILNLQYESTEPNVESPIQSSIDFWKFITPHYKNNSSIFFDIFNEPRIWTGNMTTSWDLWQKGGVYNGITYVGMQDLVDTIRNTGATNVIYVEGSAAGESLQGLVSGEGTTSHLLQGSNLVYSVHPYFGYQHLTKAQWDAWFGNAAQLLNAPVEIGEWDVYDTNKSGCIKGTSEPLAAKDFLNYLDAFPFHIGVVGWALVPGTLIRGDGNLASAWNFSNPTNYDNGNPSTFSCYPNGWPYPNLDPHAQGIGTLLTAYFASHTASRSITTTVSSTPTISTTLTITSTPTPSITKTPTPTSIVSITVNHTPTPTSVVSITVNHTPTPTLVASTTVNYTFTPTIPQTSTSAIIKTSEIYHIESANNTPAANATVQMQTLSGTKKLISDMHGNVLLPKGSTVLSITENGKTIPASSFVANTNGFKINDNAAHSVSKVQNASSNYPLIIFYSICSILIISFSTFMIKRYKNRNPFQK